MTDLLDYCIFLRAGRNRKRSKTYPDVACRYIANINVYDRRPAASSRTRLHVVRSVHFRAPPQPSSIALQRGNIRPTSIHREFPGLQIYFCNKTTNVNNMWPQDGGPSSSQGVTQRGEEHPALLCDGFLHRLHGLYGLILTC
jgi:hypothetical protein